MNEKCYFDREKARSDNVSAVQPGCTVARNIDSNVAKVGLLAKVRAPCNKLRRVTCITASIAYDIAHNIVHL